MTQHSAGKKEDANGKSHNRQAFARRYFLAASTLATTGCLASTAAAQPLAFDRAAPDVAIELPQLRVPVSFVIDDSTCLVNMGHFCTPQFATAWPDRTEYQKDWKSWPREIPDAFVREFGTWCAENEVRGKYSIVPNPACVGWIDRELPGWSRTELQQSLKLVRELMVPNWDIHPEMITHTRVIDLKTGRPINQISSATMENSFPQQKKSVDELAAYLAYALRILKNCDLPCEGVTTPGGFGNKVKQELSLAVGQAVADVYPEVDLPHYFKYVETGESSTEPKLEHLRKTSSGKWVSGPSDPNSEAAADQYNLIANVPAGTGDWFGGWQGDREVEADRYLTIDGQSGRMAELIKRKQPAVMLCHWPGMYCNGQKTGFHAFQRIVRTLRSVHGDSILWMKLSEIGRYYTARQLTTVRRNNNTIHMVAPFAAASFTIRIRKPEAFQNVVLRGTKDQEFSKVSNVKHLRPGNYLADAAGDILCCFDLPKGMLRLELQS